MLLSGRIDSWAFDMSVVAQKLFLLSCWIAYVNWRTFHTSHRSLTFILLPQMSTARPTIFHGGSTLRICLCISEITIHKDGAKCHLFVSHGSIRIYCLVTTSILMFYGKLFSNNRNAPQKCSVSNSGTRNVIIIYGYT